MNNRFEDTLKVDPELIISQLKQLVEILERENKLVREIYDEEKRPYSHCD